ncbi:unnamed protein product [Lepeophtheirus salmonis]|uniref:(salmon louse) hypothetical protein n=1 Tax=Lepeophtheirus salmonis TaxID=72036 RepID=A0A7R8CXE9_LEPSM|nr:unnamed protein product [Lepeophtheirus salmonis]CAF2914598.1 unnamed protein product [Lepeophtheirus salmonis]
MGSLSESTLCRICAQDTQTFCSLYLESSKDLRHQISFFLPLIVMESSSMPKVVCQRCVTAIGLVSEFFDKLNQGQVKLLTEILGPKRKKSKRKEEEDFSDLPDFEDDNILESDSLKHEDTLENASMRFECLEPSCRLRFPNAEEIENHLKVENHSTMTLVVPSEDVDEENRLDEIPSNSMLQEIKDPCVKDFPITPANIKKGRKSHELSLSLKNRIVGMTEAGMTATQIAKRIPIPRTTIVSIVKKYLASGNVDNKARSGRPKVWTDIERKKKMSRMTIRRKLQELKEAKKRKAPQSSIVGVGCIDYGAVGGGEVIQTENQIPQPELQNPTQLSTTISLSSLTMDVPNLVIFQEQG